MEGLAVIIDDPRAHLGPTKEELLSWETTDTENARQQVEAAKQLTASHAQRGVALSEAAVKKRQERQARKAQNASTDPDLVLHSPSTTTVQPHEEHPESTSTSKRDWQYTIDTPSTSEQLSWYNTNGAVFETIEKATLAGIWDFPSNSQERARRGVFRALWEQGFYLGGGIKFGGEYLVYPGECLRI